MKGMNKKMINKMKCFIMIVLLFSIIPYIIVDEPIYKLIMFTIIYLEILLYILVKEKFDFLKPKVLFVLFYTKAIGLSPLFYTISSNIYVENQYSLILCSLLLIVLGYGLSDKIFKNRKNNKKNYKLNEKNSIIFIMGIIMISFIGDFIYFYKARSFIFSGDYENGRILALQGNGMLIQMMGLGKIGLCLLFEEVLNKKINIMYFATLAMIIIPASLLTGFRSELVTTILIIILMYYKFLKQKNKKINMRKVIIFGIIAVIIIGVLGVIRSGNTSFIFNILSIFRNGSINLKNILITFPTKTAFQHGYTYLINIIMLKPGPDIDFTLWLKQATGLTFAGGGVTPTLLGEYYMNFGYIGMYIGMFLTGSLVFFVERYFYNSKHLYYSSFVVICLISITSGGFSNIEITFLITSIVYASYVVFSGKREIDE